MEEEVTKQEEQEQLVGFHNRITVKLAEEVDEIAQKYGIRKSAILEQALRMWVDSWRQKMRED